jgi:hypothetical protein
MCVSVCEPVERGPISGICLLLWGVTYFKYDLPLAGLTWSLLTRRLSNIIACFLKCMALVEVLFIECRHINVVRDHEVACSQKYTRFMRLRECSHLCVRWLLRLVKRIADIKKRRRWVRRG